MNNISPTKNYVVSYGLDGKMTEFGDYTNKS